MKRKNYGKELKSKVALAAIKGNQTVNEIASEFGIHTSLVNRWKKEAIEALPHVSVSSFGAQVASQQSPILRTGMSILSKSVKITSNQASLEK